MSDGSSRSIADLSTARIEYLRDCHPEDAALLDHNMLLFCLYRKLMASIDTEELRELADRAGAILEEHQEDAHVKATVGQTNLLVSQELAAIEALGLDPFDRRLTRQFVQTLSESGIRYKTVTTDLPYFYRLLHQASRY